MDYYEYVWGLLKYWLPLILFIISITVIKNVLLLIVSITWVIAALFFSMLTAPEDERRIKKYE